VLSSEDFETWEVEGRGIESCGMKDLTVSNLKNATKNEPIRQIIPNVSSEIKICINCSTVAVVQKGVMPAHGIALLPETPAATTVRGKSVIPANAIENR
jgi:hypothetical protein